MFVYTYIYFLLNLLRVTYIYKITLYTYVAGIFSSITGTVFNFSKFNIDAYICLTYIYIPVLSIDINMSFVAFAL